MRLALPLLVLFFGSAVAPASIGLRDGGWERVSRQAPDIDADDGQLPAPASQLVPKVDIFSQNQIASNPSDDQSKLTFTFSVNLANQSLRQLSEVDLALAANDRGTGKELFRTPPVPFTKFYNIVIPHIGTFLAFNTLSRNLSVQGTIPASDWRTDTYIHVIVTKVVPVADESDLSQLGNLISYMWTHHTSEIEKACLKNPAAFKAQNPEGTNACLAAVTYGSPNLIQFMVDHGADLHAKATNQQDAMFYAAASDKAKNLDYVLKQGFNVNGRLPNQGTPLIVANILNANKSIRWLIDHGADVNAVDAQGVCALDMAILSGGADGFDMLVAAKADVHIHNKGGFGLMHYAIMRPNFLPKVLAAGVPVDDATPTGVTPLMSAAVSQLYPACKWLLDHGAKLKAKDNQGRDVLDYARMSNTLQSDEFFRHAVGDLKKYGGD